MRLKRVFLGMLPLAGVLLLAACSQSTTAPGSTVSYQVQSNQTAYAVLQNANGSVISSKTIAPGTNTVTFDNVPVDAQITTLITFFDNGTTHHYGFTAPATVLQGKTIYRVGNTGQSSGSLTVSGPCPSGSNASTRIYALSAVPLGGAYPDYNYRTCTASSSSATGYSFSFPAYYQTADTAGSFVLTLFAQGGTLTTPAVARYMTVSPTQTSLNVATSDWKPAKANTSSITFSPGLATGETAYGTVQPFAVYKNVDVPLTTTTNDAGINTAGTSSLTFSGSAADLSGATTYDLYSYFERQHCNPTCIDNSVYTDRASNTAPLNDNVVIGTDTWPTLQTFTWKANATTSPVVTYPTTSAFSSAQTVYADVNATTGTTDNEWEILDIGGTGSKGTITYPDLPSNLQSFIPVPGTTNMARMSITDVNYQAWWFFAAWPATSNEVDAQTTAATTASLKSVPHTRGPHFLGGSGLQMR